MKIEIGNTVKFTSKFNRVITGEVTEIGCLSNKNLCTVLGDAFGDGYMVSCLVMKSQLELIKT